MSEVRRIELLSVLLVAALLAQNAVAGLVLPDSSHYDGRAYYGFYTDEGYVRARIDFAVYDTVGHPGEFTGEAPGTGQYIYAYQIFCEDISVGVVDFFGIVGIGENALGEPINDNIGWVDDQEEGIQPDYSYITASPDATWPDMGVWEFENGLLAADEHSCFLVLRSDNDWKVGHPTFDKTDASGTPGPGADAAHTPEPGTIALLGLGSATLLLKRRRKTAR